jgi:hypothetical protein
MSNVKVMETYKVRVMQMGGALSRKDPKQEIYFEPELPLNTLCLGCKDGILIDRDEYECELNFIRKGKKIILNFEKTENNKWLKLMSIGV